MLISFYWRYKYGKNFIAVEERTYYRDGKAYSAFLAVFKDENGIVICATSEAIGEACIKPGKQRDDFIKNGVSLEELNKAHIKWAYENVRLEVAGKVRPDAEVSDLEIFREQPVFKFRGEKIIGNPVNPRLLRDCSSQIGLDHSNRRPELHL
jgi:hypothetical protein